MLLSFHDLTQMCIFHSFPTMAAIFVILAITCIPSSQSADDQNFSACKPTLFRCGDFTRELAYPFWGGDRPPHCGHPDFELKCKKDEYLTIRINETQFRVLDINEKDEIMTISRMDFLDGICPQNLTNTTLNEKLFVLHPHSFVRIYYNCTELYYYERNFHCPAGGEQNGSFCLGEGDPLFNDPDFLQYLNSCSNFIYIPIKIEASEKFLRYGVGELEGAINEGFDVDYNSEIPEHCPACVKSGGLCGSNSTGKFVCNCPDESDRCLPHGGGGGINPGKKIAIVVGAAGFIFIVLLIVFLILRRRAKKKYAASSVVSRNISSDYPSSSVSDLERMGSQLGVHIFSYKQLEEATENFSESKELGDGGFGTVYHGILHDGRSVAVKRLYNNNFKRMEQFINEVEILTRLRHQNLVSLYGCTSRRSHDLLLVYEYINNGTVADHLHGERAKPGSLPWNTRLKIAVETASALTYLHASDVIHRDVKTNNILLDNSFTVKVADFGLSRLFPMDVSHVSTAPQGTPGYVDPEYHQYYQLTDKSDVFSFGVVLVELISSKPAVDITRHRHEINLSNMALNKIQNHALQEFVDPSLGFDTDYEVQHMISSVAGLAFRCLQHDKDHRPCMEEVFDILKSIQSEEYYVEKADEFDVPADDVVLLKSGQLTLSPDTVHTKWISNSTTPNISG